MPPRTTADATDIAWKSVKLSGIPHSFSAVRTCAAPASTVRRSTSQIFATEITNAANVLTPRSWPTFENGTVDGVRDSERQAAGTAQSDRDRPLRQELERRGGAVGQSGMARTAG
jgi:hypothetical protein